MRKNQGIALLISIGLLAGLLAIVATIAVQESTVSKARTNRINKENAKMMAQAGIAFALATLSQQSASATTQNDQWNQVGGQPTQPGSVRYDDAYGTFRVQILDANSLIDINTATQAQLQNLPLTQAQVDCLLDWREPGTTARADGAKDDYYTALTNPYLTRLGRFYSIEDLLLVSNWVPQTLYDTGQDLGSSVSLTSGSSNQQPTLDTLLTTNSLSPNTNAQGQTKININAQNFTAAQLQQRGIPPFIANAIFARKPISKLSQIYTLPGVNGQMANSLLDQVTTQPGSEQEGLLDLNTVTLPVLNTVPNMTPDVAQAIINQQQTGFTGLSSLLSLSAGTQSSLQSLVDYFCVASNTFIVRVQGTSGSTNYCMQATIQLQNNKVQVTSEKVCQFPNMPVRWGWYTVTSDTVLVDPSQVNTNQ